MEWIVSAARLAMEGGLRLGMLLALAGGLILLAHRLGLPEPGIFREWLLWASSAVTVGLR